MGADNLGDRRLDGRRDLRDVRETPERDLRRARDVNAGDGHAPLDADEPEDRAEQGRLP
jgi:S-adenosylmethionine synthetase